MGARADDDGGSGRGAVYVLDLSPSTSTLVVDTTSDNNDAGIVVGNASHTIAWLYSNKGADGKISLREAIIAANNTTNGATPDEIHFEITDSLVGGAHTILVGSVTGTELPTITDSIIIDGTTDSDFGTTPIIELDGSSLGGGTDGFNLDAGNSTIRGLVINNFGWSGIDIQGADGNTIVGNYIGTDVTGTISKGNGTVGINVSFSEFNTIGGTGALDGNLISGNSGHGIRLDSGNTTIIGNLIGTDAAGTGSLANSSSGIYVNGTASNTIGGATTAERNVISGNANSGIFLFGTGATNNEVSGNYIGTDVTGTVDFGNGADGVLLLGGANSNTIGGATDAHRNIIAGNDDDGIEINGDDSDSNVVQKNWIGLGADGSTVLGNSEDGILISNGADANQIGGIDRGNVIAGSGWIGVELWSSGSTISDNQIQGNFIGTDATGTQDFGGQQQGILFNENSSGNLFGGVNPGEGNIIANNGKGGVYTNGIQVTANSNTGNALLGNQVYNHDGLGIELGDNGDGVTLNDGDDSDGGANNLQNFPILTLAATDGGSTITIDGTMNSATSTTYRLEFFASATANGTGYGEAERYLGSANVTTDGSGNATFSEALSAAVADGEFVTATATVDLGGGNFGDTSEFAANVVATVGTAAPTDLSLGVAINTNGGTDTYLHATNGGSIMNNLNAITVEAVFQVEDPNTVGNTLVSYRTGLQHNEFYLTIYPDGQLWLAIDSIGLGELGSVGRYTQLLDGDIHHVAVSWDSATGDVIFYVDGAQAEAPLNYQQGKTIASGGNLVLGLDQDATGDVFEADEAFRGTLHDVRIWNDVRTAGEIALDHEHKYDSSSIPTGLIANWQMKELAGSTTVVDLINPGTRDLTVQHVGAVGAFTPGNATDAIEIAEGSSSGTHVTYVRPTDPEVNADGTYTYTLTDDAGGRFAIDNTTGEVTTANGVLLDYESSTSHSISVRVTDAEGGTYDETITISLINVNDAPVITSNGGAATAAINVDENTTSVTTVTSTDVDGGTASYSIIGGNDAGLFSIDSGSGALTFDSAPDFETPTDSNGDNVYEVTVQVSDGNGGTDSQAISVTVTDMNEDPTGSGSLSITSLNDNAGATTLFASLAVDDVDAGESDLSVTITLTNPAAGTISGGGFADLGGGVYQATGLTVATANTALDNVTFTPTNNTGSSGTFNTDIGVTVNDQGGGGEKTVLPLTTVTMTRVNDAPDIDLNGVDGGGANHSDSFVELGGPVNVADTDAIVTDVDNSTFLSLNIDLSSGFTDGISEQVQINSVAFNHGVSLSTTTTVGSTTFDLVFNGTSFAISRSGGGTVSNC